MDQSFRNIFVPIDFSANSRTAVSKALEIITSPGTIHLFHVHGIFYSRFTEIFHHVFTGYSYREVNIEKKRAKDLMESIKNEIEASRPDINVILSVAFGEPIERAIANSARLAKADLIVIGKRTHHPILPLLNTVVPSRLTSNSGISVLTAKPGSVNGAVSQVVIPVGCQFPEKKLEVLETLHSKYNLHVRLVIFQSDINRLSFPLQYLINKLRLFRNNRVISVDHEILKGSDKAKVLIRYCEKVGADMLIVQPGAETRIKRWPGSYISDLIPATSKTQVLSIRAL